jgi:subtilisin family serine protease
MLPLLHLVRRRSASLNIVVCCLAALLYSCKAGQKVVTKAPSNEKKQLSEDMLPELGPFANDANDAELRKQFLTILSQHRSASTKSLALMKATSLSRPRRAKTLNVKMRYPVAMIAKTAGRQGATDLGAPLRAAGGKIKKQLRDANMVNVEFSEASDDTHMTAVIDFLKRDSRIDVVEPDFFIKLKTTPNDPEFGRLWGLKNSSGGDVGINVLPAWQRTTGDDQIIVGVIDTGIDCSHPDLADNCWVNPGEDGQDSSGKSKRSNNIDDDGNGYIDDWQGWNFIDETNNATDDHFHGSHVAGTIGAVGNNNIGVVGVNWRASLVPLKFLDYEGGGYISDAIEAIDYATKMKFFATNNSWGGGAYSDLLRAAIDRADAAGVHFVAAAGNSSGNNDKFPEYPASYDSPNIVTVAAIDSTGQIASFSCYGEKSVDVAAPGAGILSTTPGGSYETLNGTSMAAPYVTGAMALLRSEFPDETPAMLRTRLFKGVTALPTQRLDGRRVRTGGMINVMQSMTWMPDSTPPSAPSDILVVDHDVLTGSPSSIAATITFKESGDDAYIGQASSYVVRFSKSPILDSAGWDNAQKLTIVAIETGRSDKRVKVLMKDIPVNTVGWFAARAYDEEGNESATSEPFKYDGFLMKSKMTYDGSTSVGLPSSWTTENDPTRGPVYSDGVGYYTADVKKRMTLREFKIPNGMQRMVLRYWTKYSFETGFDFGRVFVQGVSGSDTQVDVLTGHKNWNERSIDLTNIAMNHLAKGKNTLTVYFVVESDEAWNYDGWLIDDLEFLVSDSLFSSAAIPESSSSAGSLNIPLAAATGSLYSYKYFSSAFGDCLGTTYDGAEPVTPVTTPIAISQSSDPFGARSLCIKAKVSGVTNLVYANYNWFYENAAALVQANGLPSGRSSLKNPTLQISAASGSQATSFSYAFSALQSHSTAEQFCRGEGGSAPSWSEYLPLGQKPVIDLNPTNSPETKVVALCVRGRSSDGSHQILPVVYSWVADFEGPTVTLEGVPAAKNNLSSVKVSLKASDDLAACRAKLISGSFTSCSSANEGYIECSEPPRFHSVSVSQDGPYTLCLYGRDSLGNLSQIPVSASWTRDGTAQPLVFSGLPSQYSNVNSLDIGVSAGESGKYLYAIASGLECDPGKLNASSLFTLTEKIRVGLPAQDGPMTVCGVLIDDLGNRQQSPTVYTWTKDTAPPSVSLSNLPGASSADQNLNVGVSGGGATDFQWALLSQLSDCAQAVYSGFVPISTRITAGMTGGGAKRLCVKGKDAAGNLQQIPTSHSWTQVSTLAQVVSGLPGSPTSATSIRIRVGGGNVVQYQYAMLRSANSNCVSNIKYGAWVGIGSPEFSLPIPANTNGFMTLCIRGKNSANQIQTTPSIYRWLRVPNTTSPASQQVFMNIAQVSKTANSQTLSFNRNGNYFPAEQVAARLCSYRPSDGALLRCIDRSVTFSQGASNVAVNFTGVTSGAWVAFVTPSSKNRGAIEPVTFIR